MLFSKVNKFSVDRLSVCLLSVLLLNSSVAVRHICAAMDPRFEIDTQSLTTRSPSKGKVAGSSTKRPYRLRGQKSAHTNVHGTVHVVKSGDNLFKILMRDYGLNNSEAELFIEEIRRENNIYDIRRLKVGQRITIPPVRRNTDGSMKVELVSDRGDLDSETVGQSFRLEPPVAAVSDKEISTKFRPVWDKLVPPDNEILKPISIQTPTFSLTLDPQSYPMFITMDKGRIVVDVDAKLPSLVKALISEKDPSVRFITEPGTDGKRIISSILASAGFYSVEENFKLEFGVDPTLSIRSDFKIEKQSDSVLNQDVVLLNAGRLALPASLGTFLAKEGFSLHEPFAQTQTSVPILPRSLIQITSQRPVNILDSLLAALSIPSEKDCRLDIFTAGTDGITLSVNAERYFERNGQKTLVTHFDGDPVSYTLFRILETRGYKVVILDQQDDFRNVTDKLLLRLNIKSVHAKHAFEKDPAGNYSLQMSGYRLEGAGLPLEGVFITNLELDRVIRDVLTENGYVISVK